ncbi:N-6 DNA methylase, partial [Sulfurimonas sp.]|uniref:type IIG restriction enzyme/methyltransferase n=1 Tax=Sulfurimonas sp. TaxID=2022749 RepID=UPI0019F160AC
MGLKPKIIKPSDFINPLLSKKSVEQEKFEKFQNSLNELLKVNKIESEEHQKNAVRDFLVHSFGYEINTKARIDWAIFKNAKVEVLIEAKRLDNLTEMLTKDELNRKAFHEAILYFMQERADGNINLKHIIILTAFSWFIFDAKDFDRLFWQNKQINKIYTNYKNPSLLGDKTKDFYENIAKELQKLQANLIDDLEIECAYFNLQEPQKRKDLLAIYKLLSPDALLKEFNPNDANSLNREFYNELLYILGLEETKQGSKKIISKATNSQSGSLYENISNKLVQYGKFNDFETIIKLIIIWINRILFLKLLESQIVSWNKNKEFKFLNSSKIDDYDKLEMLFFEILAKRPQNRIHREFDYVPYLNSSLFEIHANEDKYLKISNLEGDAKINYYSKTVLKDEKKSKKSGQTSTLAYLFEFLDAYDFGSTSDEIANESKSLINASVLGLIFEKINGYKDGSFYTPSFITMYMARESLRKSILEKFNTAFSIEAKNFEELRNYCDKHSYKSEFIEKANKIIDSLTICDPAVGSGHFLVSALNEIIYIKYQLGLFNLRGLKIELINDELLVKLEDEWFEYTKPKDFQSPNHTVQKMLFLEKQRIIENQLFGVDINPNSSQITKLRLWIELLKNSYYDANYELITLPNIDINIKTGNSLISRFDLKDEIKINNIKHEIKNYKERVREYKENLGTKKDVLESIESLKNKFRLTLKAESKAIRERNIKLKEYVETYKHENLPDELILVAIKSNYNLKPTLFDEKPDSKKQKIVFEDLTKLQKKIDEIEKGKIYEDAFEWRFEFPEVLDEEGNFVGFDIVIGNPPYGAELSNEDKDLFKTIYQNVHMRTPDTFNYFISKSMSVIKDFGRLSFIVPNNLLFQNEFEKTRELYNVPTKTNHLIQHSYCI